MARKRAQSTKEQKGSSKKTSSASRGGVNSKSNAICAKNNFRSSTTRARSRSVKRDLKSTDVSSKRTQDNPGAKENGAFLHGKKRNSSVQELCDSPSKKPKLDCAKAPKQKGVNSVADDKSSLHQQQDKTSALSKQASKGGKHNNEVTSQSCSSGLQEVHKVAEAAKDKGKQKKASPLKQNHVVTPKSIQKSPRKDKIVGKKLKLDSDGEKKYEG